MLQNFKKLLSNENNTNDYFEHRILNTDIYKESKEGEDSIIFGCGCFWGAEKCFWKLPGVVTTSVGYAGGSTKNPTYNDVCSGFTGHSEVVKVIWNKSIIDISDLLKMFWECHDPTQRNRQGNDTGTQYRSAIFYFNKDNEEIIFNSKEAYQNTLSENNLGLIETEIKQIENYYYAENYHQQYLALKNSRQYCSASPTNIKLANFKGSNYKLDKKIWENFDWTIEKCVLRSDNKQIKI
tara:strand:+ start:1115 stop:1828 length:714 start_codon:yes stop_codon:yes gene_type:complete